MQPRRILLRLVSRSFRRAVRKQGRGSTAGGLLTLVEKHDRALQFSLIFRPGDVEVIEHCRTMQQERAAGERRELRGRRKNGECAPANSGAQRFTPTLRSRVGPSSHKSATNEHGRDERPPPASTTTPPPTVSPPRGPSCSRTLPGALSFACFLGLGLFLATAYLYLPAHARSRPLHALFNTIYGPPTALAPRTAAEDAATMALNSTGAATSVARVYADVNAQMPRAYWDYDSVNISWGVLENYEVVRKIGRCPLLCLKAPLTGQAGESTQRSSKASMSSTTRNASSRCSSRLKRRR
jgi:hypothetical protein